MKRLLFGLVALGLFAGVTAPAEADYLITTIDVPASIVTQAFGINNAGQVVGAYRDSGSFVHGFLLSGGSYTTLDVPATLGGPFGVDFTIASGINSSGLILGWYEFSSRLPPIPGDVGFLFSGGNYTAVSANGPNVRSTTQALGINDCVEMVGSVQRAVNGSLQNTRQAFLLSGGSSTLFDPPGAVNSVASGINNAGQIVGNYQAAMGGPDHGFLLSNGIFSLLDVPGALSTDANGINDFGEIVGVYRDASDQDHGFLYSDGNYTTIDVPGAFSTDVNGINDLGQIAGGYLDTAGGRMHGFLASPVPEPSTLLLVGLATACLLGWAWWSGRSKAYWRPYTLPPSCAAHWIFPNRRAVTVCVCSCLLALGDRDRSAERHGASKQGHTAHEAATNCFNRYINQRQALYPWALAGERLRSRTCLRSGTAYGPPPQSAALIRTVTVLATTRSR